jgi:hypothetical protein
MSADNNAAGNDADALHIGCIADDVRSRPAAGCRQRWRGPALGKVDQKHNELKAPYLLFIKIRHGMYGRSLGEI